MSCSRGVERARPARPLVRRRATRSRAGTFSRKRPPNQPRKPWRDFLPDPNEARFRRWNQIPVCALFGSGGRWISPARRPVGESAMSLGTILVIILIIFLLGGFSGRFGGYGYGYGHSGMGLGGVILVVLLILLLLGKL